MIAIIAFNCYVKVNLKFSYYSGVFTANKQLKITLLNNICYGYYKSMLELIYIAFNDKDLGSL